MIFLVMHINFGVNCSGITALKLDITAIVSLFARGVVIATAAQLKPLTPHVPKSKQYMYLAPYFFFSKAKSGIFAIFYNLES